MIMIKIKIKNLCIKNIINYFLKTIIHDRRTNCFIFKAFYCQMCIFFLARCELSVYMYIIIQDNY